MFYYIHCSYSKELFYIRSFPSAIHFYNLNAYNLIDATDLEIHI